MPRVVRRRPGRVADSGSEHGPFRSASGTVRREAVGRRGVFAVGTGATCGVALTFSNGAA